MIQCLFFDFGNIWINLQHQKFELGCKQIGLLDFPENWPAINENFEAGLITADAFIAALRQQAHASNDQVVAVWNSLIETVPAYRMQFLQHIKKSYRLFLLSNTDAIHIQYFREIMGEDLATVFFSAFERLYFSFEMGLRKPDTRYFEYVLQDSNLKPESCFLIDDRAANISAAAAVGIRGWHLNPESEDIVNLERQLARL